jgi:transcriptional regulator
MYNLPYFKEKNEESILAFMKAHSFAMLIGCAADFPAATQVPLLFDERGDKLFLRGHIMRNTDHHKALAKNSNVLCVFTGAHTYVSARLYNNPQVGSTWNYITVHAKGTIKFLEENELINILKETTTHYENDAASPASFENLPHKYVTDLAKAIAGFEIEVAAIENVFKLSQNTDEDEYKRIAEHLETGTEDAKVIASEMQKRTGTLFQKA